MDGATDWHRLSLETLQDRRSGKRVQLVFPIEVSGFDRTGRLFSEKTKTLDISETGCRFLLKTPLVGGDVIAIRSITKTDSSPAVRKAVLFQVMWASREENAWAVGALKLQAEKIWRVAFPPSTSSEPSAR